MNGNEKSAEDRDSFMFQKLFDLMPQLGWTALPNGWIDFYNQGWYDFTGTDFQSMQSWGWESVHHPDHIAGVKAAWNKALVEQSIFEMECPLRKFDGSFHWFLTRTSPIFDDSGELLRWVGINIDMQRRKELESELEIKIARRTAELETALQHVRDAGKERGSFMTTAAHEIRTPLGAILALSELLKTRESDEELKTYASEIYNSSRLLLKILNDIVNMAKLESGKLVLNIERYSIRELCHGVRTLFSAEAARKSLEFQCVIDKDVPERLQGDRLRTTQVLTNLVSNALKFTQSGSVTIKVFCSDVDSLNSMINLEVIDTGIGIEPKIIGRLFKPFVQADSSISQKYGGTGLGLAASKMYCDLMGGTLTVDSELGEGALFRMRIPVSISN